MLGPLLFVMSDSQVVYPRCDPTLSATRRHFVDLLERLANSGIPTLSQGFAGERPEVMTFGFYSDSLTALLYKSTFF